MAKKLTKSWAVTLLFTILTAILPVVNEPLEQTFGIVITEQELTHFLTAFGITAAAGVGNAVRKQIKQPATSQGNYIYGTQSTAASQTAPIQVPAEIKPKTKHDTVGVKFGPPGAWYQTNFVRDNERGNVLPYGQAYLWVKVDGVRSYITAQLKDANGNIIQIDQSHDQDEDNDKTTTRLEMFSRNGSPLPRGKYYLQIRSDSGSGDSRGIKDDEFEIV